ncbi:hypothetical protein PDN64_12465 [Bacillus cereus group sp. Bc256]|uniref:hypothetical protein n=1 Tax=unclassified Bacillus cereus group TaxID=2750818 RepID=UPI001F564449|nr:MULTISPECIES: hypothetical protein [unclassified Bacillus cereus group]MDA2138946.1 hypothetical protein [Bacillus cereus group sp. Bc256]MDA2598345.1 hypothetical protein [Bacillus cereus group sp. Bc061]
MTEISLKDRCIQILATIPTIVFFIWSIYYCFQLFVGNEIPGVNPFTKFILGLITLFMGIGGLINLTKPNVDAVEFSVKTICGLLAIGFILWSEKFIDIAKLISESL